MAHTCPSMNTRNLGLKPKLDLNSRRKLKPNDVQLFAHLEPDLFADIARAVCSVGMLPQKELHECWQMALSVHKEFPDCARIADLASGHGLLAWILVLLARSSEKPIARTAVAIDIKRPKSAALLQAAITKRWPDLEDTVHYVEGSIDAVHAQDGEDTLLVAIHACGSLSDRVLLAALNSQSAVAIMPCCHSLRKQTESLSMLALAADIPSKKVDDLIAKATDAGQPKVIDQFRIDALTAVGYEIREASISSKITAFNRIIMGKPARTPRRPQQIQQVPLPDCWSKRRGEVRAHETIASINVASLADARTLSKRPSCTWHRTFDLSFWVNGADAQQKLLTILSKLVARFLLPRAGIFLSADHVDLTPAVFILDQYVDPATQRSAYTFRIEIKSSDTEITRDHAITLRKRVCRALKFLERHLDITLR
jgi:hypothetical protein